MFKVVSHLFVEVERGAAPQAARLLADVGVTQLAARDLGSGFVSELGAKGNDHIQRPRYGYCALIDRPSPDV